MTLTLLLACAPEPPGCERGLDANADGVCDRAVADWSEQAWVEPGTHRGNIYELDDDHLAEVRRQGLLHAYAWPVSVTGIQVPYWPLVSMFSDPDNASFEQLFVDFLGFADLDTLYELLDLPPYPDDSAEGIYALPRPEGAEPGDPMGVAVVSMEHGDALNFSCAVCHASELFGRTVMGLSSRRSRPNAFFHMASNLVPAVSTEIFIELTDPTEGEIAMYEALQEVLPAVGSKDPEVLGLDSSLAQVGLSLARRNPDAWATRSAALESDPAASGFEVEIADSKPMVWWTLKYKTRWLADGALVSGNPALTNFLWNEIGRGTDLTALEGWLEDEQQVVDEVTVAIFATEAPRWTDFFGTEGLDEAQAVAGQALFDDRCASCHGRYDKGWEGDVTDPVERFATTRVWYHGSTPRFDVGTDPGRAQGMAHLEGPLNALAISGWMDTVIRAEDAGYVPPPLDGIWARYPYLHNNAVPTLCDLLRPAAERPTSFYQGPADDPATDFDSDCVGYPTGEAIPEAWREDEAWMDTSRPGLSNAGHDTVLLGPDGTELTDTERAQLVMFLKTL